MRGLGIGAVLCLCLDQVGERFVFDNGGVSGCAVGLWVFSCCQSHGREFPIHFVSGALL